MDLSFDSPWHPEGSLQYSSAGARLRLDVGFIIVLRLVAELEVDGGPGWPGSTPGSCGPGAVVS